MKKNNLIDKFQNVSHYRQVTSHESEQKEKGHENEKEESIIWKKR